MNNTQTFAEDLVELTSCLVHIKPKDRAALTNAFRTYLEGVLDE